jgi:hypothetical protein
MVHSQILDNVEIGVVEIGAITPYSIQEHFTVQVAINKAAEAIAMLDSGSAGNFISPKVVEWLELPTKQRAGALTVTHVVIFMPLVCSK